MQICPTTETVNMQIWHNHRHSLILLVVPLSLSILLRWLPQVGTLDAHDWML